MASCMLLCGRVRLFKLGILALILFQLELLNYNMAIKLICLLLTSLLAVLPSSAALLLPPPSQHFNNLRESIQQFYKYVYKSTKGEVVNSAPTYYPEDFNPYEIPEINVTYQKFAELFGKYANSEGQLKYREYVFNQNVQRINKYNQNLTRKFNMGLNDFTDLTPLEFQKRFANLLPEKAIYEPVRSRNLQVIPTFVNLSPHLQITVPFSHTQPENNDQVDWSCYSGEIDNQGICGSCYAFIAASNVASLYTMQNKGFHIKLSVQELISCSDPVLSNGCQGGLFQNVFEYIRVNGLTTSLFYPYTSAFETLAPPCDQTKLKFGIKRKITSYQSIARNCLAVKNQLKRGPLSVGISSQNLQFYRNGIFSGPIQTITDHAVLLVGYDQNFGFKIKNIWGKTWGMLGYAWVSETQHAGICSRAMSISIPGPSIDRTPSCP